MVVMATGWIKRSQNVTTHYGGENIALYNIKISFTVKHLYT